MKLQQQKPRMMKNKRADLTAKELTAIIIILASSAILIFFIARTVGGVKDAANLECAAAVREAHFQNINPLPQGGRENAKEIKACQTTNITIRRQDLPSDWTKADLEVKRRLAEQMRICWRDWGEGELDLFNEEGLYCHMCVVITFDKELKDDYRAVGNGQIKNFSEYLANTTSPNGKTYAEYLTGYVTPGNGQTITPPPYYLPVDKDLVIMYSHEKQKGAQSIIEKVSGLDIKPSTVGVIGGVLAATPEWLIGLGELRASLTAAKAITMAPAAYSALFWEGAGGGIAWNVGKGVFKMGGAMKAGAETGGIAATAAYIYARSHEDWLVVSGIYITPYTPDNVYVQSCQVAASTTVSP